MVSVFFPSFFASFFVFPVPFFLPLILPPSHPLCFPPSLLLSFLSFNVEERPQTFESDTDLGQVTKPLFASVFPKESL